MTLGLKLRDHRKPRGFVHPINKRQPGRPWIRRARNSIPALSLDNTKVSKQREYFPRSAPGTELRALGVVVSSNDTFNAMDSCVSCLRERDGFERGHRITDNQTGALPRVIRSIFTEDETRRPRITSLSAGDPDSW